MLGQRLSTNQYESISMCFSAVLGTEPKAMHMLGKHSTTELHPQPTFQYSDN
jgi:hypothetical protein